MPTVGELKDEQLRQWESNAEGWNSRHAALEREARQVTEWLCREAQLAPGMRVLDLACGSGHPSVDEARLVLPGGSVVATDFSPQMVEFTRRRASDLGLDNIETRVVDAEHIDVPDSSFDAVTMRFGIMFCPRPELAASEVLRVLKPGRRFALSVWADPVNSPAQTVVRDALAQFGRPQPPLDFTVPGVHQLAPTGKLEALLKRAGFKDVRLEPLHLIWEFDSVEAVWQRQGIRTGPVQALVRELPAEEVERLKGILGKVVEPYTKDGIIRLPVTPLCAVAQK
ncbi:MAG TPA: methyltransferase domain-containing protein [Dehalococcoidia bacterium]|nr:methyltransferase domain-containing protein [Dehalococcoidia bacterium]